MSFTFEAQIRTDLGKGASRRLRRADQVPAIVYGANQEAVSVSLNASKVTVAQFDASFYESDIVLVIDGKEVNVKLAAVQRHPVKNKVVHMDFIRA
jgi:large subunit ribosomal protein L25